jgi:hypothetical protein
MPLNVTQAPITDPNDPNYDATKDPNSPQYQATTAPTPASTATATGQEEAPTVENSWKNYASQAVRQLYPYLRDGIDYSYGRRDENSDPELVEMSELAVPIDTGKVEELARKLAEQDPKLNYQPQPSLAKAPVVGTGEYVKPKTW